MLRRVSLLLYCLVVVTWTRAPAFGNTVCYGWDMRMTADSRAEMAVADKRMSIDRKFTDDPTVIARNPARCASAWPSPAAQITSHKGTRIGPDRPTTGTNLHPR